MLGSYLANKLRCLDTKTVLLVISESSFTPCLELRGHPTTMWTKLYTILTTYRLPEWTTGDILHTLFMWPSMYFLLITYPHLIVHVVIEWLTAILYCLWCTLITTYSLIQFKGYNSKFKFLDGVQFRKYFISLLAFYLIIWLMKSPKNFEKTSILKIWWLVFFRDGKTHFGEIPLKSYIFRHDKNWFSPILPHNIYFSH